MEGLGCQELAQLGSAAQRHPGDAPQLSGQHQGVPNWLSQIMLHGIKVPWNVGGD